MNLEKQVTKLKTLYEGLHNEKVCVYVCVATLLILLYRT